jgi:hypothetical protein
MQPGDRKVSTKTARLRDGRPYVGNAQFLGQGIKKSCGKCAKHFSVQSMKHHRIYGAVCAECSTKKAAA